MSIVHNNSFLQAAALTSGASRGKPGETGGKDDSGAAQRTFKTTHLEFRDSFSLSEDLEEEAGDGEKPGQAQARELTLIHGDPALRGRYEELARSMGGRIDANGNEIALNDREVQKLGFTLSSYDLDTLSNLQASGYRIRIMEDSTFPQNAGAATNYNQKLIKLRSSQFGDTGDGSNIESASGIGSARHEVGHAIDDMLFPDGFTPNAQSTRDPKLFDLYENYRNRVEQDPSARWDGYPWDKLTPAEYVGEGFEAYHLSEETRNMLKEKDPGLYAYIEDMLQKSKAQNLPEKQEMPLFGKIVDGIGQMLNGIASFIGNIVKGIGETIGGLFGLGKQG